MSDEYTTQAATIINDYIGGYIAHTLTQRREQLADLAHQQWVGWMGYLFSKCELNADGTVTIPAWAVERWQRQIKTPYAQLSESEKESDRAEADKFINAMRQM